MPGDPEPTIVINGVTLTGAKIMTGRTDVLALEWEIARNVGTHIAGLSEPPFYFIPRCVDPQLTCDVSSITKCPETRG